VTHRYVFEHDGRAFVVYATDKADAMRVFGPVIDQTTITEDDDWTLYPAGQCEDRRGAPGA
jgi:hypothetical protein